MTMKECAERMISLGFAVFPLAKNTKVPPKGLSWKTEATLDPKKFEEWLEKYPGMNYGIATKDVVVVDVDCSNGKNGLATLLSLELEGKEFPKTLTQTTPTGGIHYFYRPPYPLANSVGKFKHIDTRAVGGYVVGAGSKINGKEYTCDWAEIVPLPEWFLSYTRPHTDELKRETNAPLSFRSEDVAAQNAVAFLKKIPPLEEGTRNQGLYSCAAKIKDFGVGKELAFFLIKEYVKTNPPLNEDELRTTIWNAYTYGSKPPGVDSPEGLFNPSDETHAEVLDPVNALNQTYAGITLGGGFFILRENKNKEVKRSFDVLQTPAFKQLLLSKEIIDGNGKKRKLADVWMESPFRRTYSGLCFCPGKPAHKDHFNIWQGFSVEPLDGDPTPEMVDAVDLFLDHLKSNICQNDEPLFKWLLGYFAHLMQRPYERPNVALVFRGKKGTGKNVVFDVLGDLVYHHYFLATDRRQLLGNFNAHIESALLFVLDEAMWSGDKAAEGKLKGVITSEYHLIERKGIEQYRMDNFLRVCILGNEDWLVPATGDERRFAVFDVGDGRIQDRSYFAKIKRLMREHGGNRYLLKYLLNLDISDIDVRNAPHTRALDEQKEQSMNSVESWTLQLLKDRELPGMSVSPWKGEEGVPISAEEIYSSIKLHAKELGFRYVKSKNNCIRDLRRLIPKIVVLRDSDETRKRQYYFPNLTQARESFRESSGMLGIDWDS